MGCSQYFVHKLCSSSEFQTLRENMIFPWILRKLIFQRPPVFSFKQTSSDNRSPVLIFFWFPIIFCHIRSLIAQMKSLEKNKQLKNSPLKQDTDTMTFTKWQFSSNYLMARTFRVKLCSVARSGLCGTSSWRRKKKKKKDLSIHTLSKFHWCLSGDNSVKQNACAVKHHQREVSAVQAAAATAPHRTVVRAEQPDGR